MKRVTKLLNHIFVDGFSGMALGLFATLIIGTIIGQIASMLNQGWAFTQYLSMIASCAKFIMGAGIGVGIASKYKASPLVAVSGAVAGMVGAQAVNIIGATVAITKCGDPLSAFVSALVAIELGRLVSGKTKIDILVTPAVAILSGSSIGLLIGPYISRLMTWLGSIIEWATVQQPFIMGIVISVLMGMFLTLPISSAAIGIALSLSGISAGAAVVGCCCQMVGFAVISYRENKVSGLIAQGLGTSMLQMPNIVKHPLIWLPAILSSAILGPISTCLVKLTCNSVGSGMGTSGLVGLFGTYDSMIASGHRVLPTLFIILIMEIAAPALLSLLFGEAMRKLKLIGQDDLRLDLK
ncbi:MAG: PTS transporter subunit IIC [Acutalibacteraceae bacterium]